MASKGPKSGKPAPAAAKPKPAVAKARVAPEAPVTAKAVAEPVIEKKKPAPKAPVAAKPAPAPVEPAPIAAAAPIMDAVIQTAGVPQTVDAPETTEVAASVEIPAPETTEVAASVETPAPEAIAPEPAVSEPVVSEAVVPETIAPVATKSAPVFKKEFRMTVDPKTLFTDFNDRAKAAMEKSAKTVEELNDFAKGNVEALVESSKITAKGLEAISQEAAEYSRKSFETATAALKNLAAAKSPTDFFKLQSDFFRGAFDSYVAEASKTTEAVLKLAGEAAQPISSRVALAAEKAKIAA